MNLQSLVKNLIKWLFILSTVFYAACGVSDTSLKKQAYQYCDIYNPKNWDSSQYKDAWELQRAISKKIQSTIKSKQILHILDVYASDHKIVDFHQYMETELSKLIGEKWDCPAHKKFFTPSENVATTEIKNSAESKASTNAQNGEEVVIWIDKDGNYYINSSDKAIKDAKLLKDELTSHQYGKMVIKADRRVQHQYVVSAIDVGKASGIADISIATKGQ